MSNYLAIATVTETLKYIVYTATRVLDPLDPSITASRPDDSENTETEGARINIFLYRVTPNLALRNDDLPTRRSEGELVQRPQTALDLHYLLTFYGDGDDLEPERMLGSVVSALHAQPILTREMIQAAIDAVVSEKPYLAASDLAEQVETIKFTPLVLDLEELSKIWSVFFQVPYSLSIAYQASVVLIEREEIPQEALPVRERNLYVVPFRQPVIEEVRSEEGADQPVVVGDTLLILGSQLRGDVTLLRIGEAEVAPEDEDVKDDQISLQLEPSLVSANGIRAGLQGVQVVHQMLMGTPVAPHSSVESNMLPFVLRPTIGVSIDSEGIHVTFNPAVGKDQRVSIFLNEFDPPSDRSPHAYLIEAPALDEEETDTIIFPISGVEPGQYLVRVQVNGAQNILEVDADPGNPRYIGPTVEVT